MQVSIWVYITIIILSLAGGMVAVISSQNERHSWAYHLINGIVAIAFLAEAFTIFYFTRAPQSVYIQSVPTTPAPAPTVKELDHV